MRRIILRPIAALLVLFTLFETVACTAGGGTESPSAADTTAVETSEQRLVLEDPVYELTDAERGEMVSGLTDSAAALLLASQGMVADAEWREGIRLFCEEKILPLMESERMTAAECLRLCDSLDTLAEEWRANDAFSPVYLRALWENGVSLLGKERFGALTYQGVLLGFDELIAKNDERFESYGYEWYKTDADALRESLAALTGEVGKDVFTGICETLWAIASLSDLLSAEKDSVLNDAEVVKLLQKIADDLAAKSISGRQWEITARACFLLLPDSIRIPGSLTAQQKKEWRLLLKNDYPAKAFRAMPALVNLLEALGNAMTAEKFAIVRDGTTEERVPLFCGLFDNCPEAFLTFLNALAEYGSSATDEEAKAVSGRSDDYSAFLASYPAASAETVLQAVHARATADSADTNADEALRRVLIGFGVRIAPYLTFAFTEDRT